MDIRNNRYSFSVSKLHQHMFGHVSKYTENTHTYQWGNTNWQLFAFFLWPPCDCPDYFRFLPIILLLHVILPGEISPEPTYEIFVSVSDFVNQGIGWSLPYWGERSTVLDLIIIIIMMKKYFTAALRMTKRWLRGASWSFSPASVPSPRSTPVLYEEELLQRSYRTMLFLFCTCRSGWRVGKRAEGLISWETHESSEWVSFFSAVYGSQYRETARSLFSYVLRSHFLLHVLLASVRVQVPLHTPNAISNSCTTAV